VGNAAQVANAAILHRPDVSWQLCKHALSSASSAAVAKLFSCRTLCSSGDWTVAAAECDASASERDCDALRIAVGVGGGRRPEGIMRKRRTVGGMTGKVSSYEGRGELSVVNLIGIFVYSSSLCTLALMHAVCNIDLKL
jgi:hypothetical protein